MVENFKAPSIMTKPELEATFDLGGYRFVRGYPTAETIEKAYDDADLVRALGAYKFFYPTVSMYALWEGCKAAGLEENKNALIAFGSRRQMVFTPNSDTAYAGVLLDLSEGPVIIDIPAGSIMAVVNDMNQRWVADMGLPGPDAGKGGKHMILPPGYQGTIPAGPT